MIQCNYLHSQPSDAAADAEFVAMATRTTITITDSSRPVAANKELFSLLETVAVVPGSRDHTSLALHGPHVFYCRLKLPATIQHIA